MQEGQKVVCTQIDEAWKVVCQFNGVEPDAELTVEEVFYFDSHIFTGQVIVLKEITNPELSEIFPAEYFEIILS